MCSLSSSYTDTIQGAWSTTFDGISVNGSDISVTTKDAIIGTGTPLVVGDQKSVSNIYAKIPGSAQIPKTDLWSSTLVIVMTVGVTDRFMCK